MFVWCFQPENCSLSLNDFQQKFWIFLHHTLIQLPCSTVIALTCVVLTTYFEVVIASPRGLHLGMHTKKLKESAGRCPKQLQIVLLVARVCTLQHSVSIGRGNHAGSHLMQWGITAWDWWKDSLPNSNRTTVRRFSNFNLLRGRCTLLPFCFALTSLCAPVGTNRLHSTWTFLNLKLDRMSSEVLPVTE